MAIGVEIRTCGQAWQSLNEVGSFFVAQDGKLRILGRRPSDVSPAAQEAFFLRDALDNEHEAFWAARKPRCVHCGGLVAESDGRCRAVVGTCLGNGGSDPLDGGMSDAELVRLVGELSAPANTITDAELATLSRGKWPGAAGTPAPGQAANGAISHDGI